MPHLVETIRLPQPRTVYLPLAMTRQFPPTMIATAIHVAAAAGLGGLAGLLGLPLALGGIVAISAGVAFASRLPERRMRLAFCALLVLTAGVLAVRG